MHATNWGLEVKLYSVTSEHDPSTTSTLLISAHEHTFSGWCNNANPRQISHTIGSQSELVPVHWLNTAVRQLRQWCLKSHDHNCNVDDSNDANLWSMMTSCHMQVHQYSVHTSSRLQDWWHCTHCVPVQIFWLQRRTHSGAHETSV